MPLVQGVVRTTTRDAAYTWLAQERAARRGGQPIDTGACREEEDTPILAPRQVRGQLRQQNTPQQFPRSAAHPHAAGPGTEDVAALVHLEAIRHARLLRRHIYEDPAVRQGAIGLYVKRPEVLVGG